MKKENKETWNYAVSIIGLFFIGLIMIYPIDQTAVFDDISRRGEFAQWYAGDCQQINSRIEQAGGVLPYYLNRKNEKFDWQYKYRIDKSNFADRGEWRRNRK